jgi:hypothetical protein
MNTPQYRKPPYYEIPLTVQGNTHRAWYRHFQDADNGLPPEQETSLTASASPYTYQAPRKGFVIITGGTVSLIQYSRSGTFYNVGQTSGIFPLNQGDQLKVTYSAAPTLTWVPT